jgi:hypothetical protein
MTSIEQRHKGLGTINRVRDVLINRKNLALER